MNNKLFCFTVLTTVILTVSFSAKGNYYPQHSSSYEHQSNQPPSCTKCGTSPPDCRTNSTPPQDGGPPCSCNNGIIPRGCILKPCDNSTLDSGPCDCTHGFGGPNKYCHRERCSGADGACETCDNGYPPDCNATSFPPDQGGAPCSCAPTFNPDGCTIKPCRAGDFASEGICICQQGIQAAHCYFSRCLGSGNTTNNVETASTTSSTHNPGIVSGLASLLTLGHVSSDGHQKAGILGNILGG